MWKLSILQQLRIKYSYRFVKSKVDKQKTITDQLEIFKVNEVIKQ